jgi:hypothetical protein
MVYKVAVKQDFLCVLNFPPARIIPPTTHVYFNINTIPIIGTSGQSKESSNKMFFQASRSIGQRSTFTLIFSLQGLKQNIAVHVPCNDNGEPYATEQHAEHTERSLTEEVLWKM